MTFFYKLSFFLTGQQGAATAQSQNQNQPWYQIRRAGRPFTSQPSQGQVGGQAQVQGQGYYMGGRRTQSQENVSYSAAAPPVYLGGQTSSQVSQVNFIFLSVPKI